MPYSGFHMGAAVVTDGNAVVPGALVENVSLGLAMCAERAALFSVVAQGLGKPEILALVARRTSGELTWPCGACLQVAMELGGADLLVIASDGSGDVSQARLHQLASRLPFKGDLKKDSPSCGMTRVRVYGDKNMPTRKGRGLYASALMAAYSNLLVEDEGRLNDCKAFEHAPGDSTYRLDREPRRAPSGLA